MGHRVPAEHELRHALAERADRFAVIGRSVR
jgi:hypothetical protein